MPTPSMHVLLIEDRPADSRSIEELLADGPVSVERVRQLPAGLERLAAGGVDIILLDLSSPDGQDIDAFLRSSPQASQIPVVVVIAPEYEEFGIEAVCQGAQDYLLKTGLTRGTLMRALRCALERKRVEENLHQSQESYRRIVEFSNDAIIGTTLDGIITNWNKAAEGIYGFSEREAVGQPITITAPRGRPDEPFQLLNQIRQGASIMRFETTRTRKDGKEIDISLTASPIPDQNGAIIGASAIVRDITEHHRMEQQLRQAQKMEALGTLAGGVAHDFNNLLGVMIGYCEIFLDQLSHGDPLRAHAEEIKKAGDRATALTRQLLAFSHQQAFEVKAVNLNTIVTSLENTLRHLGEDIKLHVSLDSALGSVKADPGQIEQVIVNLAANARDSMPKGGKLLIETTNVDLNEEYVMRHPPLSPGRYAMLAISDTGMGMDAQTQAHVFEPSYTKKADGAGAGLGLATVYGVVKQSGGNIWVYSEPGVGSTFKVCLPRVDDESPRPRAKEAGAGAARASETILLVEDEQSLRGLIRIFLQESGYTVLEADSGDRAIELTRAHRDRIDLLLTDVVMPGANGRAVAESLASIHPETKVIYMSGYTGSSVTHRGLLDSHAVFLQKPFTRSALLSKVREVLELQTEAKVSSFSAELEGWQRN